MLSEENPITVRLRRLLDDGEILPVPPAARRVIAACARSYAPAPEIVAAIKGDRGLSALVVKAANTTNYTVGRNICEVSHALTLLGQGEVGRLALSLNLKEAADSRGVGYLIPAGRYAAEEEPGSQTATSPFNQALGKLILALGFPDEWALFQEKVAGGTPEQEACANVLGVTLRELVAEVIKAWSPGPQDITVAQPEALTPMEGVAKNKVVPPSRPPASPAIPAVVRRENWSFSDWEDNFSRKETEETVMGLMCESMFNLLGLEESCAFHRVGRSETLAGSAFISMGRHLRGDLTHTMGDGITVVDLG